MDSIDIGRFDESANPCRQIDVADGNQHLNYPSRSSGVGRTPTNPEAPEVSSGTGVGNAVGGTANQNFINNFWRWPWPWHGNDARLSGGPATSTIPPSHQNEQHHRRLDESPPQTYVRLLLKLRHGYPLWRPGLLTQTENEIEDVGVRLGDVGFLQEDGLFCPLFNVCRPADDAINARYRLPIRHYKPESSICTEECFFNLNTVIATPSILCDQKDFQLGHEMGIRPACEFSFASKTGASEGAFLVLPNGADRSDFHLTDFLPLETYARQNAMPWFKRLQLCNRADSACRRSLYLITGYDKCDNWCQASFSNTPSDTDVSLSFVPYTINSGGMVLYRHHQPRAGYSAPIIPRAFNRQRRVKNQSVFIRGYRITWHREPTNIPTKPVKVVVDIMTEDPSTTTSGGAEKGSASPPSSSRRMGFSENSGGNGSNQQQDKEFLESSLVEVESFPGPSEACHPLDYINDYLLSMEQNAQFAITHDHLLFTVIEDSDDAIPDGPQLLRRILEKYSPMQQAGCVTFVEKEVVALEKPMCGIGTHLSVVHGENEPATSDLDERSANLALHEKASKMNTSNKEYSSIPAQTEMSGRLVWPLFAVLNLILWPWIILVHVWHFNGIPAPAFVTAYVATNERNVSYLLTLCGTAFAFATIHYFSDAIVRFSQKWFMTRNEVDVFHISFFMTLRYQFFPWRLTALSDLAHRWIFLAIVLACIITFNFIPSGISALLAPVPIRKGFTVNGTELDLASTDPQCGQWLINHPATSLTAGTCGPFARNGYTYTSCIDENQLIDALESGRNNILSWNRSNNQSQVFNQLGGLHFLAPIQGILPIGPNGVPGFDTLAPFLPSDARALARSRSYNYTLEHQGVNNEINCSYDVSSPVNFSLVPNYNGIYQITGTCPDGKDFLGNPQYFIIFSHHALGFWACRGNPGANGNPSYLLYFSGKDYYNTTIANITCNLSAEIGTFLTTFSQQSGAFVTSRTPRPPSAMPVQLVDQAIKGFAAFVPESQGFSSNLMAVSLITLGTQLFSLPLNRKDDTYLRLFETLTQGVLEYQASYTRLVYTGYINPTSQPPPSCIRAVQGNLTYEILGWHYDMKTVAFLLPATFTNLASLVLILVAMYMGDKVIYAKDATDLMSVLSLPLFQRSGKVKVDLDDEIIFTPVDEKTGFIDREVDDVHTGNKPVNPSWDPYQQGWYGRWSQKMRQAAR